ncbi:2-phospho-L-lactate transferase [Nitratireductor sp. StC3]|uniref:2-phospho-L-lactate transferase n=1 Tax=Nitratireductor sp. StC3 TaxID=2126741 RepID=UPI000D0CD148|nr:2-phospho-L-lactate transferase [Nitratireductor sp. StC3]PSM17466.1 2-phospho-L-lactate transferase [Nitratireductor sp. StC3]
MSRTVSSPTVDGRVVALCGGIGGAKLALGLSHVVPADRLTIIVNTGDDFRHFGLHVSPDIDTVTYTLAGRSNRDSGWGRDGESWRFMEAVKELGGESWFALGDTDLATKAVRTQRLAQGARLTEITGEIARALGVGCTILPATDDAVATIVDTDEGALPFQHYFVGRRWQPQIRALRFDGAERARPTREALAALGAEPLAALVICPSNPYLSIDPMLAIPGLRDAIRAVRAPVVAVSPLVGGKAVKGPLAKMIGELGHAATLQTIADHYADFLDILIADEADSGAAVTGPKTLFAPTLMHGLEESVALARTVLAAAGAHAADARS